MYNNIKIKSLEDDFKTVGEDSKDLIELYGGGINPYKIQANWKGMILTGNDGDGTPRKFGGKYFEKELKGFFKNVTSASGFASHVNQYITNTKRLSNADMKKLEVFYKKNGGDKGKNKHRYEDYELFTHPEPVMTDMKEEVNEKFLIKTCNDMLAKLGVKKKISAGHKSFKTGQVEMLAKGNVDISKIPGKPFERMIWKCGAGVSVGDYNQGDAGIIKIVFETSWHTSTGSNGTTRIYNYFSRKWQKG